LTWWAITHDDLAALVELAAECYLADGGLGFMNEPDNLSERYFPDTPGAAMGAWAAGGNLVACAAVHLIRESDTERAIIVGQVRPKLRSKGIGTYLMHWSQEQALALFTAPPVGKQVLQVATESLTESADRLYQANGFESVFESLVMQRDLRLPVPDKTLPPGVTLTSWQTDLAEHFFQAYQAAFRNRPGFPGWSVSEWIARVLDNDFKPEWSLLARAGEMPLGFVIGTTDLTTDPPGGEVWQIGVIPTQRRRGLASALLVETMRRMQAAGALSAQLTVHINNPGAIQTYIQLGFAMAGRRARYERIPE
jgi:mycothiol synthase